MNILVVEDDTQIQTLLTTSAKEVEPNSQVFVYASSEEARQLAIATRNDLFILDIQLLDYKGTDLAKQLREMEEYKYTPMIFATALATEELLAYRELKCYSFLIKPFTKDEIKKEIAEALGFRKSLAEVRKTIRIEQKSHIFEYDLANIMYVESFGKKLELHIHHQDLGSVTESISGYSLSKMLKMLHEGDFIQCHKSYLVNRQYISAISKADNTILLRHIEQTIPIGQKFREALLHAVR